MAQFWHPTGSIISPDNPGSRLLSTVSPSSTLRAHLPGLCRPASRIRWRSPVALARRETTTQASQGDLAPQSAPQDEEDPPPRPREGPLTWGGAKRARTADLLHAIWRQHVHPRPYPQVTVLPRPRTSARVQVSCCTSVLYGCHPRCRHWSWSQMLPRPALILHIRLQVPDSL